MKKNFSKLTLFLVLVAALPASAQLQVKNSSGFDLITVTPDGKMGIGATNPSTRLAVLGLGVGTGYPLVYNPSSGSIFFQNPSSILFKMDIQPLQTDFTKILQLQPMTFRFRENGQQGIGLMAEDLDALGLKELVIYDESGKPGGIHYEKLSLYLLEVVKGMRAELDALKARRR